MRLLWEKYNGIKTDAFFIDCARLKGGEPLAYIIGWVPFLNTKISLDSHPLIPRTETEFWVDRLITDIKNHKHSGTLKILDLCAGSGCIGIALLKNIPNAQVDFAEIDVNHHGTIQKNISENNIDSTRTHIFLGDLFEYIPKKNQYDYIISNPPYIDPIKNQTEESVKKFEPGLALYGGKQGTEVIFQIMEKSPYYLKEDGVLVIEHDPEQTNLIRANASPTGFCTKTDKDQYGTDRLTRLYRKAH